MAKIFVRERIKIGKGDKKPRFAIIAIYGTELSIVAKHIRKQEIEAIAGEIDAEVVYLKAEKNEMSNGDEDDEDEDDEDEDEDEDDDDDDDDDEDEDDNEEDGGDKGKDGVKAGKKKKNGIWTKHRN